ncbi:hypothetical protein NM688_g169 [Phlebia brevispora]|uniref:Uncharacterized protein n=1 Tax=Phlebia brevispora TaxID=194682 RepID=A0ACC1TF38_9APHY|nr:hypothetical protein NM688_g169 [Phlebia brevispora]
MSATTPDTETISTYQQNLNINYITYAALTIVCYEFIATLQHEYELVWKQRWTGATWLFLANRCHNYSLQRFMVVLLNLPILIIAVFSALRVFALLGHAYIPAAFTLALGIAPVALGIYQESQVTYNYVDDPALGSSCYAKSLIPPAASFHSKNYSDHIIVMLTHLTVVLAMILATIVNDVIAITITWIKTYRHVREASSIGTDISFSAVLLQYGSLYFIVILIVDLTDGLALLAPSVQPIGPVETFTIILPNVVLSRFLINLRQTDTEESDGAAHSSRFSTLNFRMPSIPGIIGNLGELLAEYDDDADNEDAVAETYKGSTTGTAVDSSEGVGTSHVMNIGSGEIGVIAQSV